MDWERTERVTTPTTAIVNGGHHRFAWNSYFRDILAHQVGFFNQAESKGELSNVKNVPRLLKSPTVLPGQH